jgi:hypothetical protein
VKLAEIEERLRRIKSVSKEADKGDVIAMVDDLIDDLERARLLAPREPLQ